MISVGTVREASGRAIQDMNRLLSQLRENPAEHTTAIADLQKIVTDTNVVLIVAKDDDHIIGMGTLYMITKLGKNSGLVEDVVVDSDYRGQGLGQKIMEHLIDSARSRGIKQIYLTSRPGRAAGNNLYQKLGFEKKETNVYVMKL